MSITREDIRGAAARAWCTPENEHKVMDEQLALAAADEFEKLLIGDCFEEPKPQLGCATTKQLIDELAARADVSSTVGEEWPSYRTVDDQ